MRHTHRTATLCLAIAALLLLTFPAAAKKNAPTTPGTYTDWNGEIDQFEIVETFSLADYSKIVVGEFSTDGVELPDPEDNAYEPVQKVLEDVRTPIANGIRKKGPKLPVEVGDGGGEGVLLVRGRILEMNPGSQAARYWGGFGAGAAGTKIEGELVDAASGRVLVRFTQERRSGTGAFGGGYVELLKRNLHTVGRDVGIGLKQF